MTSVKDIFGFVIKNMFEKKSRVILTIAGIVIGIFTFVFFLFASQGLSNAITEQFSSLGVNTLNVQTTGGSQVQGGGPPVGRGGLSDTDIARIQQVTRNVDYITPVMFYQGRYEQGNSQSIITTVGWGDRFLNEIQNDLDIEILEGRFLRNGDRSVLVLGGKTAIESFENEIKVGQVLRIQDRNFRVIGIIEERGDLFIDNSLIMPFSDIQQLSGIEDYSAIRVSFLEGANLDEMKEAIDQKLNPRSGERRVTISSPEQAIEQFNQILGVLTLIISFISSIALLVGGINVMNTMYSNVLERINEISVIKAMGGTNKDIILIFLIESSILGFIGAVIGFFGAYLFAEFLSFIITNFLGFNVPIYFNLILMIQTLILTSIFTALFGTYPAFKAAKVNPADNLRDE